MGREFHSLDDEGFGRFFDEFQYTAYRLETLNDYYDASEEQEFRSFLAGEPPDVPELAGWLEEVAEGTAAGRSYQRVHVVTEPLSDYVRFECAWGYRYSVTAGEDVRILAVPEGRWPEGIPRRDYWLFDSVHLLEMRYAADGSFICAEVIDDPAEVVLANHLRDRAVHLAIPFTRYATGFDEYMRRRAGHVHAVVLAPGHRSSPQIRRVVRYPSVWRKWPAMIRNTRIGDSEFTVQAGVVHGDIRVADQRAAPPVPRQLPPATSGFVNRHHTLRQFNAFMADPGTGTGRAAAASVSAVVGQPGVGKTACVLHWAHSVRSRFTDGDLYIDLRGHGPGPQLDTAQALEVLLRTLGAPPERIPDNVDGRAALYRSLLDGKRTLVVIDNASTTEQVRHLLPSSPRCLTIVTSRTELRGLVAREGARRMVLHVLTPDESLALLRDAAGTERIEDEPQAARRIVAYCSQLPLALRIVAERITGRPHARLADIAAELADERERLDTLGGEDDELSDVRAVFTTSYRELDAPAARLFRLLGLHPGREVSVGAAAALAGTGEPEARRALDRLARGNLLEERGAGRYRVHDLLHLYCVERVRDEEDDDARSRARRRVVDWYLRRAHRAHHAILPAFPPVPLESAEEPDRAPIAPQDVDTVDGAMGWFETERENLAQAVREAARGGHHDLAWRLAATASGFFELHGHWSAWRDLHLVGVEAADAACAPYGQASNYLGLGDANWLLGRAGEALDCYQRAATHAREAGDGWSQGFALRQVAVLHEEKGRVTEAVETAERALDVFREIHEKRGEGMALLTLAACYRRLARADEGMEYQKRAIDLFSASDDAWSVAWARCELGDTLGERAQWEESADQFRRALDALRTYGDRQAEARALIGLAESRTGQGDTAKAHEHYREAEAIIDTLEEAQAAELRERLPG